MKPVKQQERTSTSTPYVSYNKLPVNNLHLETFENQCTQVIRLFEHLTNYILHLSELLGAFVSGLTVKYLGGFIYLAALETPGQVRRIP